MKKLLLLVSALVLTLTFLDPPMGASAPERVIPFPDVPRITVKETKDLLGDPDVAIIDARPMEQWKYSDQLIQGAVHEDPFEVDSWVHKYRKDQTLIIYCA
jgi:hypothetical protein